MPQPVNYKQYKKNRATQAPPPAGQGNGFGAGAQVGMGAGQAPPPAQNQSRQPGPEDDFPFPGGGKIPFPLPGGGGGRKLPFPFPGGGGSGPNIPMPPEGPRLPQEPVIPMGERARRPGRPQLPFDLKLPWQQGGGQQQPPPVGGQATQPLPPGGLPEAPPDEPFVGQRQPPGPQPPVGQQPPPVGGGIPTQPLPPEDYQLTDLGKKARDQFSKYALGEEDPQVTAERQRLERNNLNRTEQARRLAHERAVRSGFQPGSAQYEQMMRQGVSDANNQNIQAENSFNDFARARRSDRQKELEGLFEGEYERGREGKADAWKDFNQIVKFLPSDVAQQNLMRAKLGGQDISQSFQNMYGPDGVIKDEFKDLTKAELVKQGIEDSINQMEINPDTDKPWEGTEKKEYIDKFYRDNFENILFPSKVQSKEIKEQEATETRIQDFIKNGDASKMSSEDWAKMTPSQRLEAKAHITQFADMKPSSPWGEDDEIKPAKAKKKFQEANPLAKDEMKGKVVEKDGELYIITNPANRDTKRGWEAVGYVFPSYQSRSRYQILAKPVGGGKEIVLYESEEFDPD